MSSVINGLSYTLLLRDKYESINSFISWGLYVYKLVSFIQYIWVYSIRIKVSGNIEMNLEPKPSSCNKLSICHWNLSSLSTHNFIKLYLLRAYISIHNFNILCLSETFLDSTICRSDSNLIISGYDWWWLCAWASLCRLIFCATSQKVFHFYLIRLENLKISLTVVHLLFT